MCVLILLTLLVFMWAIDLSALTIGHSTSSPEYKVVWFNSCRCESCLAGPVFWGSCLVGSPLIPFVPGPVPAQLLVRLLQLDIRIKCLHFTQWVSHLDSIIFCMYPVSSELCFFGHRLVCFIRIFKLVVSYLSCVDC